MKCSLCPRRCRSERTEYANPNGFCKMPLRPRVARAALHFWEEPCISGKNGSGAVFFSGCSLGCIYSQNAQISRECGGQDISSERLAEIFRELEAAGAHNINLVSPTHYALAVRDALRLYRPSVPVVWNSGGYDTVSTLRLMQPYIDIYLMDFKYLSPERAARYSGAEDYPAVAAAAIAECARQQDRCVFDADGILQKGLIVRHLLLPQGTREAIGIFEWVRSNAPGAYFSIMSQYVPLGQAAHDPVIGRRVTAREYEKVLGVICESGFENCYFQSRESASREFIPPFDLTGV